ncbi:MAG: hypothetical protein ACLR3C_16225 [Eggerthella lenta]
MLQILLISPEEVAQGMPRSTSCRSSTSWRSSKASRSASTTATCSRRCPSRSTSCDALFGWEHADEEDFR